MAARPQYIVTSMRVAAGSILTVTTVATVVVMGSAPAAAGTASLASVQAPAKAAGAASLIRRDTQELERELGATTGTLFGGAVGSVSGNEPAGRLDGIRREMDQAVRMQLVTAAQAERFVGQMEERISRGL